MCKNFKNSWYIRFKSQKALDESLQSLTWLYSSYDNWATQSTTRPPKSNPEKGGGSKLVHGDTGKDSGYNLTAFSVQYILNEGGKKWKIYALKTVALCLFLE